MSGAISLATGHSTGCYWHKHRGGLTDQGNICHLEEFKYMDIFSVLHFQVCNNTKSFEWHTISTQSQHVAELSSCGFLMWMVQYGLGAVFFFSCVNDCYHGQQQHLVGLEMFHWINENLGPLAVLKEMLGDHQRQNLSSGDPEYLYKMSW